jgi:hypothetical protein
MESWLKQAEDDERRKIERREEIRAKIHSRRELILANYRVNKKAFDAVIASMQQLSDRVNALPFKKREMFGKLRFSPKTTKLQNHLHILSSSRRVSTNRLLLLTPALRKARLKHIRVAFISVSKEVNCLDLELKESLLEKRNIRKDDTGEKPGAKDPHKRVDYLYTVPFDHWNDDIAYQIIDWLAFQGEMDDIQLTDFECKDLSDVPSRKSSER